MNRLLSQRQSARLTLFSVVCACAALLLAKSWEIGSFANVTPYWDQWDAEAAFLYKPWLEGTLSAQMLTNPHNEHRILTTRILHLGLFELNGGWNPKLQMHVNAALHVAALALMVVLLCSILPAKFHPLLYGFGAALAVLPLGWENLLAGFQAQFYLLLLLSAALLLWCTRERFGLGDYVAGAGLALLLVFTMASGSLAVLAASATLAARRLFAGDRRVPVTMIFVLLFIGFAGIAATPRIPAHDALKATSMIQFVEAALLALAWPLPRPEFLPLHAAMALAMQLPLLASLVLAWGRRREDPVAFTVLVSMTLWISLQVAGLSYGRAAAGISARYRDLLSVAVLTNFAALLFLWTNRPCRWKNATGLIMLSSVWVGLLMRGMILMLPAVEQEIIGKVRSSAIQESNVRAYLNSQTRESLHGAAYHDIPYPSAARLQELLDDATIRSFLPRQLFEKSPQ